MGSLKKLVFLLAIIAALYFGGQQLGSRLPSDIGGESTLEKLRAIDASYGIGKQLPVPAQMSELNEYEGKLRQLQLLTKEEKSLVELKLELVQMQKSLIGFSNNITKITSTENCGNAQGLILEYRGASQHAKNALELGKKLGPASGFEYYANKEFQGLLDNTLKSLDESMNKYYLFC